MHPGDDPIPPGVFRGKEAGRDQPSDGAGSGAFQVLLYHGLYRDGREIRGEPVEDYVSREDFSRQVRWLKESGHHLLSLRRCRELSAARRLPPHTVCVTFDDGKLSDLAVAVPILQEAGAEATFFIIPGWLGHTNILAPSQVRDIAACGMEVGAHSMTHPFMTELDDAALDREAEGSRRFLEDLLGSAVESFSYPYGDVDGRVREAVLHAGYLAACGTRRGRNPSSPDWLLLRRWSVPGSAGVDGLRRLLARRTPSWIQSAGEVVKRGVGMRRIVAWKERWARRAGEGK
jgi:peptidoglycan/xylan/chitin deacetylase (PgdA/CDA1 family)